MIEKRVVRYTVVFKAEVEFDPDTEDEQDALGDIDIPEGGANNSVYVVDSFRLLEHD